MGVIRRFLNKNSNYIIYIMDYDKKYLKYKSKYFNLKYSMKGGARGVLTRQEMGTAVYDQATKNIEKSVNENARRVLPPIVSDAQNNAVTEEADAYREARIAQMIRDVEHQMSSRIDAIKRIAAEAAAEARLRRVDMGAAAAAAASIHEEKNDDPGMSGGAAAALQSPDDADRQFYYEQKAYLNQVDYPMNRSSHPLVENLRKETDKDFDLEEAIQANTNYIDFLQQKIIQGQIFPGYDLSPPLRLPKSRKALHAEFGKLYERAEQDRGANRRAFFDRQELESQGKADDLPPLSMPIGGVMSVDALEEEDMKLYNKRRELYKMADARRQIKASDDQSRNIMEARLERDPGFFRNIGPARSMSGGAAVNPPQRRGSF